MLKSNSKSKSSKSSRFMSKIQIDDIEEVPVNTKNTIFQEINIHNFANKYTKNLGNNSSLEENIDFFTNKVEELSFKYESEEMRALYQKMRRDKLKNKNLEENRVAPPSNVSMDFNRNVIKRLLNNSEQENRYLIDAMMNGRIASMSIPSNFRSSLKSAGQIGDLPFNVNRENMLSYKRKEEFLKKKLIKFKENEIFKFRLKFKPKDKGIINNINSNIESRSDDFSNNNQTTEISLSESNKKLTNCNKTFSNSKYSHGPKFISSSQSSLNNSKKNLISLKNFDPNKTKSLFYDCEKAETRTKSLQKKITKNFKILSKSVVSLRIKQKDQVDVQMIKNALKEKNKKGTFLYGDGKKSEGKYLHKTEKDMKNDTFKIISNLKGEDAFKIKDILTQKFSIKHTPDEILFHKRRAKIKMVNSKGFQSVEDRMEKVNSLIRSMDKKKKKLIDRIDGIRSRKESIN